MSTAMQCRVPAQCDGLLALLLRSPIAPQILAKCRRIWQIGPMQTSTAMPPAIPNFGAGHPSEPVIEHMLRQPGIQRVPNLKVAMFIGKKFLEPELCQLLMLQIDSKRRPSTLADANGDYAFRTR
jgi:hypothetical protein